MKRIKITTAFLLISFLLLLGCIKSTRAASPIPLNFKRESPHFVINYIKTDESCIDDVLDTFEKNYDRVTGDLKCGLKNKVVVNIYPDLKSLHVKCGNPDAPDWIVGFTEAGAINMVSPLNPGPVHNYNSMFRVAVHEFTHVVENEVCKKPKKFMVWLSEGTAAYEACQFDDDARKYISHGIKDNSVPSLDDINSGKFADIGGYQYSYTVIDYIVKDYGYDKLISLIESPDKLEDIFGVSKQDFEKRWMDFLYKNYK